MVVEKVKIFIRWFCCCLISAKIILCYNHIYFLFHRKESSPKQMSNTLINICRRFWILIRITEFCCFLYSFTQVILNPFANVTVTFISWIKTFASKFCSGYYPWTLTILKVNNMTIRITTGKTRSHIKHQHLRKVWIWTFG